MTVPSTTNRWQYTGNGSTTSFAYTSKIFSSSDLVVIKTDANGVETTLVLNTDYTVSGAGDSNGGTVTYPVSGSALPSTETLTIKRVLAITQNTSIKNQGAYYPEIHEDEFDKSRMIDQQQQGEIDRSIRSPDSEAGGDDFLLPPVSDRAGKILSFDANGNPVATLSEDVDPVYVDARITRVRYTTDILTTSTGATTGDIYESTHYDLNKTTGSGAKWQYTGTTTVGKAGTVNADGYVYDADGKQFDQNASVFSLRAYGAGSGSSSADVAAMTAAIARGKKIVGDPSLSVNFATSSWTLTSGIKIDWRGASITSTITPSGSSSSDEDDDNMIFLFDGTAESNRISGIELFNGKFTGSDLLLHAYKFRRCYKPKIYNNDFTGMLNLVTTYATDIPKVDVGTDDERPDVSQDLTDYLNSSVRSHGNTGLGSTVDYDDADASVGGGAAERHRWSLDFQVSGATYEYYRQGIVWKGGGSDQSLDGDIDNDRWARGSIVACTVRDIHRGGIWGNNGIVTVSGACQAIRCGDFGIHGEGDKGSSYTGNYIEDCSSGIGQFSYGTATYTGNTVVLNDSTLYSNEKLFSHVNSSSGDAGQLTVTGNTFICNDSTIVGRLTFQRDAIAKFNNNTLINCKLECTGTNHGKRYIQNNELTYTNSSISGLSAFTAIDLGGINTDGDDIGGITGNTIDASAITLPSDCVGINMEAGSSVLMKANDNTIVGGWDVEIAYRDTASGGNKRFIIRNNTLEYGRIYCLSDGFLNANAQLGGNVDLANGKPIFNAHPEFGAYNRGCREDYDDVSNGGVEGWIVTSVGAAYKEVYTSSNTYAKYECVKGSDNNFYWAKQALSASSSNDPVSGTDISSKWAKYESAEATIKDRGVIAA